MKGVKFITKSGKKFTEFFESFFTIRINNGIILCV